MFFSFIKFRAAPINILFLNMDLFLSKSRDSHFLKLLIHFTRLEKDINVLQLSENTLKLVQIGSIKLGELPILVTEEGTLLQSTLGIAQ